MSPGSYKKQIPYLDGWRGVAIGMLLIGHFFPVPGINLGQLGVNLFFVLSGLLMAKILFIEHVPIPGFYQRRISRIFPALYVFIILIVFLRLATGSAVDVKETAAAATFLINYFPGEPGNAVMPFGHIWSLCVEEHSYILLSLIAMATRTGHISARLGIVACTVIFALAGMFYWATYDGAHLSFDRWIHSEVAAFGIFASAAFVVFLNRKNLTRVPRMSAPGLILLGCAMHWWSVPAPVQLIIGVGAFALAANLLETAPQWILSILSTPLLRQLGLWSFSIYIWQQPFYLAVHDGKMSTAFGLISGVVCGVASFYVIEAPARRLINARWSTARPVLASQS